MDWGALGYSRMVLRLIEMELGDTGMHWTGTGMHWEAVEWYWDALGYTRIMLGRWRLAQRCSEILLGCTRANWSVLVFPKIALGDTGMELGCVGMH